MFMFQHIDSGAGFTAFINFFFMSVLTSVSLRPTCLSDACPAEFSEPPDPSSCTAEAPVQIH